MSRNKNKKNKIGTLFGKGAKETADKAVQAPVNEMFRNTEKETPNNTGNKSAPRVLDMSWAAEYIDDEWESSYKKAGKFDTRIIEPLPAGSYEDEESGTSVMYDLMADSRKKIESADNEVNTELAESIGIKTTTPGEDKPESPLAITQEYKAENEESEFSRTLKAAISKLENKDAEIQSQMSSENPHEEDLDDIIKIRDAETDKTIYSVEDAKLVREAAVNMDFGEDLNEIIKIRDAETDKTIVSIEDARQVRAAAASLDICDDLDDIIKIRDAETDKTIYSVNDAKAVRDAASQMEAAERLFATEKIRDAETNKTIVSIEDARQVREAAASLDGDEPTEVMDDIGFSEIDTVQSDFADDGPTEVEKTRKIDISKIRIKEAAKDYKRKRSKRKAANNTNSSQPINVEDFLNLDTQDDFDIDSLIDDIVVDEEPYSRKQENSKARRSKNRPAKRAVIEDDYYDDYQGDYDDYPDEYDGYDDYDDYDERAYRPHKNDRRAYRDDRHRRDEGYYVESKSPLRLVPLFLVIAICVLTFITAKEVCFDNPVNSSDYSRFTYTINGGISTADLAEDLYNMGLIENTLVFRLRALFYGLDCQDGTYVLSPCYSTEKIVNILSGYEYIDE